MQGPEYQKPTTEEAGFTSLPSGLMSGSVNAADPRGPKSTSSWLWRRGQEPHKAPEPPPRPISPPRSGMEQALAEMLHRPNPANAATAAAAVKGPGARPPLGPSSKPPPCPMPQSAPQQNRRASGSWLMGWRAGSASEPPKPADEPAAQIFDNSPAGIAAAAAAAAAAAYPKSQPEPEPTPNSVVPGAGQSVVGANGQLTWKQEVPRRMTGSWLHRAEDEQQGAMPTRFGGPRPPGASRSSLDGRPPRRASASFNRTALSAAAVPARMSVVGYNPMRSNTLGGAAGGGGGLSRVSEETLRRISQDSVGGDSVMSEMPGEMATDEWIRSRSGGTAAPPTLTRTWLEERQGAELRNSVDNRRTSMCSVLSDVEVDTDHQRILLARLSGAPPGCPPTAAAPPIGSRPSKGTPRPLCPTRAWQQQESRSQGFRSGKAI